MKRRARGNPRRLKHQGYTVAELAKELAVCRNTVRAWMRAGLPTFETRSGTMMRGEEVNGFLRRRQSGRRFKCGPGELPCLRCREARLPTPGSVIVVKFTPISGNARAACPVCATWMHRRVGLQNLAASGFADAPLHARSEAPTR